MEHEYVFFKRYDSSDPLAQYRRDYANLRKILSRPEVEERVSVKIIEYKDRALNVCISSVFPRDELRFISEIELILEPGYDSDVPYHARDTVNYRRFPRQT